MSAPPVVEAALPGCVPLTEFVVTQSNWLHGQGFNPSEALAVVASCRDELVAPLRREVRHQWNNAFDFSSLSELPLSGVTGARAVLDHTPKTTARREIVVFAMAHIGILLDGTAGHAERRGRPEPTTACGSVNAAVDWARATPNPDGTIDPMDAEQSLVRNRLLRGIPELATIDTLELARRITTLIREDLWHLLTAVTEPGRVDMAVVSGLLVHAPDHLDYVHPELVVLRSGSDTKTSLGTYR